MKKNRQARGKRAMLCTVAGMSLGLIAVSALEIANDTNGPIGKWMGKAANEALIGFAKIGMGAAEVADDHRPVRYPRPDGERITRFSQEAKVSRPEGMFLRGERATFLEKRSGDLHEVSREAFVKGCKVEFWGQ